MSARQTSLRVERRRGIAYCILRFSNGAARVSLHGSLADDNATDWLCRPRREYRRSPFPVNRRRRKHHNFGRRWAA